MTPWRRLGALAVILTLLSAAAAAGAGLARADGDPASDVLVGQNVFLPYRPIAPPLQRRLYAVADAAARAGYPVHIAIISAPSDLGVVPALFAQPAAYARFLSAEIAGVVPGPVLVVMPDGFGLAARGRAQSVSALRNVPILAGADGLAAAALSATERLAAAAGRPVAAAVAGAPAPGASPATIRHALSAIIVLVALAGIATTGALRARARSPRRAG